MIRRTYSSNIRRIKCMAPAVKSSIYSGNVYLFFYLDHYYGKINLNVAYLTREDYKNGQ